jgi:uncharacterized phage-associated protein
MRPRYREDKATQAAARLLKLRGGKMSHLKLIKLLYLVEREALARFGAPLSYDTYVLMPHGPVVSSTLDRINTSEAYQGGYWDRHIAPKVDHEVSLRSRDAVPTDQLSPAELALIDEIFNRYGHWSRWQLVEFTHKLPEWIDPQGSSIPISAEEILRNEGYSEEDIAQVKAEWAEAAYASSVFA